MTAKSAYEQFEKREFKPGYCLPLAIDSILQVSKLPDEYYDLCFEGNSAGMDGDLNETVGHIIEDFFKVKPQPSTDMAALAEFNAFGASPQTYMPDAPYDFSGREELEECGVAAKQVRLVNLLKIARDNSCNVIFTNDYDSRGHVSALDLIDRGQHTADSSLYFVRDEGVIEDEIIYKPIDLSGIFQTLGIKQKAAKYAPLPEVQRPYYPDGQSSWELTIFPPDPRF